MVGLSVVVALLVVVPVAVAVVASLVVAVVALVAAVVGEFAPDAWQEQCNSNSLSFQKQRNDACWEING